MEDILKQNVVEAFLKCYSIDVANEIAIQKTRKEFAGDYTINVFPWVKQIRKSPDEIAQTIGNYLKSNFSHITSFEVIKGFLNFTLSNDFLLTEAFKNQAVLSNKRQRILVEFSSPNTNKPLHLGHVRNILLGDSISKILTKNNHEVIKVNLVNDRGIHICKSMLAWQKWGNNCSPQSLNVKGDKLVGDYYVLFDKEYKSQVEELVLQGQKRELAEKNAPLIIEAQEMLRKWEEGDSEIRKIWEMMNQWVYEGFDKTYDLLGVKFDKIYYESETYELGKQYVLEGLSKGVFYKKEDGSVWINLTNEGLDEKLLLRSDGTSVYITQDIGTAILRYNEYLPDLMIYVVGNEQNYHFQVLKLVLKKLGFEWADRIYHLSYGMVELPDGKMKSREGTVVDADELINELINYSKELSLELGKLSEGTEEEFKIGITRIALAALKYFILKVDPEKNMIFNPKESIDFDGNTGPFLLYTYSRIKSLIRKAKDLQLSIDTGNLYVHYNEKERELIKWLLEYNSVIKESALTYNSAKLANYVYYLCKEFNQYYQTYPILKEENDLYRNFRLQLSLKISEVIKESLSLIGVETIEKM